MKIVLASASPRRIEMFHKNGFDPKVIPSDFNEHIPFHMTPAETVMYLSLMKGLSIRAGLNTCKCDPDDLDYDLIVSADTVVVDNNIILGKPADENDALSMLSSLSGRSHHVLTGVSMITRSNFIKCFFETSKVTFKDIPEVELREYVATPEPYDKAGGYAIQGTFSRYVESYTGDIDNIIGFPFQRFLDEINDIHEARDE